METAPQNQILTDSNTSFPVVSPPPQIALMQMITGYWVSQIIYAAAKLGIADHLKTGEHHYTELAKNIEAHPDALYRLLRALASVGIFAETKPGTFITTPLAVLLQSDSDGSLRDMSIMMGDKEHYGSWGNIIYAVKTGDSSFKDVFGMDVFEYYTQNPAPAGIFDRAMTSFSSMEVMGVITDYDFSGIGTLVDVAGGHGSLLISVLKANPNMTGILFDLPNVIEGAKSHILNSDVSDRCQLVSGSFFDYVPTGADAYILKHIIHDWDDERAIAILKQCHEAMTHHSKILVVEQVIPPGNDPFIGKILDVNMLVMCPGGKERTAEEFAQIFTKAGFKMTRIIPTHAIVSIVEGVRI